MSQDSDTGPSRGPGPSRDDAHGDSAGSGSDSRADEGPKRGPAGSADITVQNPRRYRVAADRRLRPWLNQVVAGLAPDAGSLTVRCIDDDEMRELNRTYRSKDRPTDVLSFVGDLPPRAEALASTSRSESPAQVDDAGAPWSEPDAAPHLGDIVVSVPTARRQAEAAGHSLDRELRVLILHGLLHCLGYDHEEDDGTMERVERAARRRWIEMATEDRAIEGREPVLEAAS